MLDGILLTITVYVVSLLVFVVPYSVWQWRRERSSFFSKGCLLLALLPELTLLLFCVVVGFAVSVDRERPSSSIFAGILFLAPIAMLHGWIILGAHRGVGVDRIRGKSSKAQVKPQT